MPTGVEEIVGFALGGVSLLAGFAGAVEGYHLLRGIVAKDNGLRSIADKWEIQCVIFTEWGESLRVEKGDECLLHKESPLVRGAIGLVLAEILSVQQRMTPKLKKYGIENIKVPPVQGSGEEAFKRGSTWVASIRNELGKIKQVKRVDWALQDQKEMEKIVNDLSKCNENLRNLTRRSEASLLYEKVVLAQATKAGQDPNSNPDSLVAIFKRTKELKAIDPKELAQQAILLTSKQVKIPQSPTSSSPYQLGTYEPDDGLPRSIFVEWKKIKAGDPVRDELVERIKALGALLSLANASRYRRPTCIGTFDDEQYREDTKGGRRIAFVYELSSSTPVLPTPLSLLLQEATESEARPPLGERFTLAYRLAAAVYMFHTSNWLHKSLRADSILFPSRSDITAPWITGFEYSRPEEGLSLETRTASDPKTDLYYHPSVSSGWTKLKDIYSLGILLWEIANWRPVYKRKFSKMSSLQVHNYLLGALKGDKGDRLNGLVGKIYMDVVRCCLQGDFGVASGQNEEAKLLTTAFFQKVLQELERCRA